MLFLVLADVVLVLFSVVRQNDHVSHDLSAQFGQLVVSLFNLLVKGLVFNLELLEVDQVETVCKLFLLTENLLLVSESVAKGNVLETVLMNFLIF